MGWRLFLHGDDEEILAELAESIVESDVEHGNRPCQIMRSHRDRGTEEEKRQARQKTKARRQRKNLLGF